MLRCFECVWLTFFLRVFDQFADGLDTFTPRASSAIGGAVVAAKRQRLARQCASGAATAAAAFVLLGAGEQAYAVGVRKPGSNRRSEGRADAPLQCGVLFRSIPSAGCVWRASAR